MYSLGETIPPLPPESTVPRGTPFKEHVVFNNAMIYMERYLSRVRYCQQMLTVSHVDSGTEIGHYGDYETVRTTINASAKKLWKNKELQAHGQKGNCNFFQVCIHRMQPLFPFPHHNNTRSNGHSSIFPITSTLRHQSRPFQDLQGTTSQSASRAISTHALCTGWSSRPVQRRRVPFRVYICQVKADHRLKVHGRR